MTARPRSPRAATASSFWTLLTAGAASWVGACTPPPTTATTPPPPRATTTEAPAKIVEIAAGGWRTCARTSGGEVWCWGLSPHGAADVPTRVVGVDAATQLAMGDVFTCALTRGGRVQCWGRGVMEKHPSDVGRVVTIAGLERATEVAVGGNHACAITAAQRVACWGQTARHVWPPHEAELIEGVDGATHLAASRGETCAVASGRVMCWGAHRETSGPAPLLAAPTAEALAMMSGGLCVVGVDARVHCWGQACQEGTTRWGNPCIKEGLDGATALVGGDDTMCARSAAGWRCWGGNTHGEISQDQVPWQRSPTAPGSPAVAERARALAVGDVHACSLDEDGGVACWGSDYFGVLGGGPPPWLLRRYELGFTVAHPDHFAVGTKGLVALVGGLPQAWGMVHMGELPLPGQIGTPIAPLPPMSRIVAAGEDGCAAGEGEAAWCWGSLSSNGPQRFDPLTDVSALSMSDHIRCVVSGPERRLYCWGSGWWPREPQLEPTASAVTSVATGRAHVCWADASERVLCRGSNHSGQLGVSDPTAREDAVEVPIHGVKQLAATDYTTCARREGELWCWGDGRHGTHGLGELLPATSPRRVSLPARVADVAGAEEHFCAVTVAGEVYCWGRNIHGELGTGDRLDRATPTKVAGLGGALAVRTGTTSSCAVLAGGKVRCWGFGAASVITARALEVPRAPAPIVRLGAPLPRNLTTMVERDFVPLTAPSD